MPDRKERAEEVARSDLEAVFSETVAERVTDHLSLHHSAMPWAGQTEEAGVAPSSFVHGAHQTGSGVRWRWWSTY